MLTWHSLFIVGIPVWVIIRIIYYMSRKDKKFGCFREIILSSFVLYIFSVISVTLLPIYLSLFQSSSPEFIFERINVIPFSTLFEYLNDGFFSFSYFCRSILLNLLGNLILLFPLSIFLGLLWRRFTKFKTNLLTCLIVSIGIEVIQSIEIFLGIGVGRICDIDDIIMNVCGSGLAFVIFRFLSRIIIKYVPNLSIRIKEQMFI